MPVAVTDARSNPNDQIAHAANVLKRSPRRRRVFEAIYKGKQKIKSVTQLMKMTQLDRVAVLQEGGKLAGQQIVHQTKIDGETGYQKDAFYATNKGKLLRLATNPQKLKAYPTQYSWPAASGSTNIRVSITGAKIQIRLITCDDFDQFSKVKKIESAPPRSISEKAFKNGIKRLIGETGKFQDWGGEKNDLYTSRLRHKGKRRAVAFAFKGPGTSGVLTPKKLGRNGNQIQRLFSSPAEMFIVQYHSEIHEDVIEQMNAFATLTSVKESRRIWYGVINGDDTNRLLAAYPRQFGLK